jgi:hypothetical protein
MERNELGLYDLDAAPDASEFINKNHQHLSS